MSLKHDLTCRRCFSRTLVATAIAAPLATIFGKPSLAQKKEASVPGTPVSAKSHMLDTAADAIQ